MGSRTFQEMDWKLASSLFPHRPQDQANPEKGAGITLEARKKGTPGALSALLHLCLLLLPPPLLLHKLLDAPVSGFLIAAGPTWDEIAYVRAGSFIGSIYSIDFGVLLCGFGT